MRLTAFVGRAGQRFVSADASRTTAQGQTERSVSINLGAVVLTRKITRLDAKNNVRITRRSGFYCSEDLLRQLVRG